MNTDGTCVSCGVCGDVIYENCFVFANHDITVSDAGARWYSRDFGVVVHECDLDAMTASVVAEAEHSLTV
jgi:hypothetical protein